MTIADETKTVLKDILKNATKKEYVKIFSKETKKQEYHLASWLLEKDHLNTVLKKFSENDMFISFNTFKNQSCMNSHADSLFNVYAFCIDVDYKIGQNRYLPVEKAMAEAKELFGKSFGNLIPCPAYIEYGNQFRLIYLLNGHISGNKQKKALELVAKKIVSALNTYDGFDFHAEYQPLNSFMRIAGSRNTKVAPQMKLVLDENSGEYIYHYDYPVVHYEKIFPAGDDGCPYEYPVRKTLDDYMNEVLGMWQEPEWYKNWQKKPKKKHVHNNLQVLNASRMKDLEKIRDFLDKTSESGYRNNLCFYYFIHAKQYYLTAEEAVSAVYNFNQGFKNPLYDHTLENCISSARKKNYTVKSSTLLQKCGITWGTGESLGLSICKRTVNNRQYKRKNTKAQQIEHRKKTIIKLRRRKKTNRQICISLQIPEKTLERYLSELIKERLILSRKFMKKAETVMEKRKDTWNFASACEKIGASAESIGIHKFLREMELFADCYKGMLVPGWQQEEKIC